MLRILILGIFFFNTQFLYSQSSLPREGTDFISLSSESSETNEVILYCWLGSPSCYQVEHAISQWAESYSFILINQPIIKRPTWRRLAKGRLVARFLGQEALFSSAVYKTLHLDKKTINDDDALIDIAEQAGLSRTRFTNLFYAAETNQAINDIQTEASQLPIKGVPTIILKQRWLLDASMHSNSRSILNTLDYLASLDD